MLKFLSIKKLIKVFLLQVTLNINFIFVFISFIFNCIIYLYSPIVLNLINYFFFIYRLKSFLLFNRITVSLVNSNLHLMGLFFLTYDSKF